MLHILLFGGHNLEINVTGSSIYSNLKSCKCAKDILINIITVIKGWKLKGVSDCKFTLQPIMNLLQNMPKRGGESSRHSMYSSLDLCVFYDLFLSTFYNIDQIWFQVIYYIYFLSHGPWCPGWTVKKVSHYPDRNWLQDLCHPLYWPPQIRCSNGANSDGNYNFC